MIQLEGHHEYPYKQEDVFRALSAAQTWRDAIVPQEKNGLDLSIADERLREGSQINFVVTAGFDIPVTAHVTEIRPAEHLVIESHTRIADMAIRFSLEPKNTQITSVMYGAEARFRGPLGPIAGRALDKMIRVVRTPTGSKTLHDIISAACSEEELRRRTRSSRQLGQLRRS